MPQQRLAARMRLRTQEAGCSVRLQHRWDSAALGLCVCCHAASQSNWELVHTHLVQCDLALQVIHVEARDKGDAHLLPHLLHPAMK